MKKQIIIGAVISLMFASCTKEYDINSLGFKRSLVVNALFNQNDSLVVNVSASIAVNENGVPSPITNANVELFEDGIQVAALSYHPPSRNYFTNYKPKPGKKYRIVANAPNLGTATGESFIPSAVNGNNPYWRDSTGFDSAGFPSGTLYLNIIDNSAEKNYYRISLFYYDPLTAEWKVLGIESDDVLVNDRSAEVKSGGVIISDQTFNGKSRNIAFTTPFGFTGQTPKFMVKLESLTNEYYQYFRSIQEYDISSGLFEEPTLVFTNIQNGLGIFAGSHIKYTIIQ